MLHIQRSPMRTLITLFFVNFLMDLVNIFWILYINQLFSRLWTLFLLNTAFTEMVLFLVWVITLEFVLSIIDFFITGRNAIEPFVIRLTNIARKHVAFGLGRKRATHDRYAVTQSISLIFLRVYHDGLIRLSHKAFYQVSTFDAWIFKVPRVINNCRPHFLDLLHSLFLNLKFYLGVILLLCVTSKKLFHS